MRPQYEVADVIHQFLPQMDKHKMLVHHRKTLNALQRCRTAELGGSLNGSSYIVCNNRIN